MCVFVCVCERERERERETDVDKGPATKCNYFYYDSAASTLSKIIFYEEIQLRNQNIEDETDLFHSLSLSFSHTRTHAHTRTHTHALSLFLCFLIISDDYLRSRRT